MQALFSSQSKIFFFLAFIPLNCRVSFSAVYFALIAFLRVFRTDFTAHSPFAGGGGQSQQHKSKAVLAATEDPSLCSVWHLPNAVRISLLLTASRLAGTNGQRSVFDSTTGSRCSYLFVTGQHSVLLVSDTFRFGITVPDLAVPQLADTGKAVVVDSTI